MCKSKNHDLNYYCLGTSMGKMCSIAFYIRKLADLGHLLGQLRLATAGDQTLDYTTCYFDQERQYSCKKSQEEIWIPFLPTGSGNTLTAYPLTWQSKPCCASRLLGAPVLTASVPPISFSWYLSICLCHSKRQKLFHFIESNMSLEISATN